MAWFLIGAILGFVLYIGIYFIVKKIKSKKNQNKDKEIYDNEIYK